MKRREFIILSSIGATSASLLSACGHPEEKLIPAFIPDDEYVPGIDYWKASTCGMCDAGCGIIVRTREHKANKIEGNPLHPVNRGALCARGQAGLEVLYNPDRIKGPMKRVGERGEGKWEEITWDEAIKSLADKLREIKAQGRNGSVVFATGHSKGVTGLVAELFMSAYGSKSLASIDVLGEGWVEEMYSRSYGLGRRIPTFDIGNAHYLLSFGARFLETWHSPVMYSLAYGEFRRTSGRPRGRFIQIEPRMSLTGGNADEWLPAVVGSETFVALGIAQVMVREGLAKDPLPPLLAAEMTLTDFSFPSTSSDSDRVRAILGRYAPEMTTEETGIPAERLIRIAREFASSKAALAVGEGTFNLGSQGNLAFAGGAKQVAAIHYLNRLVQNLNKPGGVYVPERDTFDSLARSRPTARATWLPVTDEVIGGRDVAALLIHSANPVHNSPRLADRIKTVPLVVSLSSFMDETAQLADLILPDHTYLERWDLKTTRPIKSGAATSLTQPIINAEANTKQTADVLIAVARDLGLPVRFESSEEIVKQAASAFTTITGSKGAENEDSGARFIEQGVFIHEGPTQADAGEKQSSLAAPDAFPVARRFEAQQPTAEDWALTLLTYEHAVLGPGAEANLPALQELPDPMTSVIWGSWVEINPKTASSLGIADGDLVEVSTEHGSVRVPAVLYPAIRPDVIAMPFGQGHTGYGRYATNRGANPAILNPDLLGTVGAKVSKIAGKATLIRFGTDTQQLMEKKPWR